MKKKMLALLLASSMVASMAACGNNDTGSTGTGNSSTPSTQDSVSTNAGNNAEEGNKSSYVGPDWEAIDAMDYDDASDALYDWNLDEFWDY